MAVELYTGIWSAGVESGVEEITFEREAFWFEDEGKVVWVIHRVTIVAHRINFLVQGFRFWE